MRRFNLFASLLFSSLLVLLSPVHADDDEDEDGLVVVKVDCNAGQSISKALATEGSELVIEISGMCEEEVQVRRSNVTLRGTNPLVDGIRPAPNEPLNQALNLFKVHLVNIENLRLTGGTVGLGVQASFGVNVSNCRVEDNDVVGVIFGTASGATNLVDTVVTGNGFIGIWVANGSSVGCTGCTVDNHNTGIRLTEGSLSRLKDSTVQGNFQAINAFTGSGVSTAGNSLNTIEGLSTVAIRLNGNNSMDLRGDTIIGTLDLRRKSVVTLRDITQTVSSGVNRIRSDSSVVAAGSTSLDGDYTISEFSKVVLPAGTSATGNLNCSSGGDAYCDADPFGGGGGTSTCGQCPFP